MTKIAIISQPEQGVLIDISGCAALHEATQHLTSTLQVSSQFWEDMQIDLNLGGLSLRPEELAEVIAILSERGVRPRHVFSNCETTLASLSSHNISARKGTPDNFTEQPATTINCSVPADAQATDNPGWELDLSPETAIEKPSRETIAVEVEGGATISGANPAAEGEAASETAQEQKKPSGPKEPFVLYLRQTLRSGMSISHKGHLVIIGDVNPGAEVIADGDITIWGALRGVAHAGVNGNTNAEIRALKFQPIQLRIAHAIARSPDRPRAELAKYSGPETARIVNGTIRISSSAPD